LQVKLTIAGGCRNQEDYARVKALKDLCAEWGLTSNVEWKLNVAYEELLDLLSLIIASGGPQMDIVLPIDGKKETQPIGFLAATKEEYVRLVLHIVEMSRLERDAVREAARASVNRFSEREFELKWNAAIEPLLA
ncbi:hypothetical protein COOONC_03292, partial [Cooperia oncophora]